jgi:hypothetical protein
MEGCLALDDGSVCWLQLSMKSQIAVVPVLVMRSDSCPVTVVGRRTYEGREGCLQDRGDVVQGCDTFGLRQWRLGNRWFHIWRETVQIPLLKSRR